MTTLSLPSGSSGLAFETSAKPLVCDCCHLSKLLPTALPMLVTLIGDWLSSCVLGIRKLDMDLVMQRAIP